MSVSLKDALGSELAAAVVKDPGASSRTKDLARALLALQGPEPERRRFVAPQRRHAADCPTEDPYSAGPCNCNDYEDDS